MQHTDINTELFENLGKLFYAVAAADRNLHENETLGLHREIEKFWKPKFTEAPYSMAYYIWHAFELARRTDTTAEQAYEEFVVFFKKSPGEFTEEVKNLILDTANAISLAYADKNKSELILLAKLHLLFND